tara:strand:- start:333 stop:548 length:216 start_codon:yes stop_codon:yes gene_type:complete
MANNISYINWNKDWVYLTGKDSMALGGGSPRGECVWRGEWPHQRPVTKINPRYEAAYAFVKQTATREEKTQ